MSGSRFQNSDFELGRLDHKFCRGVLMKEAQDYVGFRFLEMEARVWQFSHHISQISILVSGNCHVMKNLRAEKH